MKKILISFVGGRPLPNLQFVISYAPDKLYLISSKDSSGENGNKEKLINALPPLLQNEVVAYDVDPYDQEETYDVCLSLYNEIKYECYLTLQLSSEPTTMSIGAYRFANYLVDKGVKVNLYYSSRDGVIDIFNKKSIKISSKIGIDKYFSVYGWEVTFQKDNDQAKSKLCSIILEDINVSLTSLELFRSKNEGKGRRSIKIDSKQINSEQKGFFEKLVKNNWLIATKENDNSFVITYENNQADVLAGKWLEYLIFEKGNLIKENLGTIDEVARSVEDKNGKGELDFVATINGQLIIGSCKTGKDAVKANYFKELKARAESLGRGMCTSLLITTSSNKKSKEYSKWVSDYNVILTYAEDLTNLESKLKEAIKDQLRNRI